MKYFSTIILFLPILSFSQQKGDNTIIIKGVTLKEIVELLLDKGYTIEKIDSNFNTIRTEKRAPKKVGGYYFFDIRIKEGSAFVRGKSFLLDLDFEIENKGMRGSLVKESFNLMNEFALSFNKPIEYKKE